MLELLLKQNHGTSDALLASRLNVKSGNVDTMLQKKRRYLNTHEVSYETLTELYCYATLSLVCLSI